MPTARSLALVALLTACNSGRTAPAPTAADAGPGTAEPDDAGPKLTVLRNGELPGADGFYLVPASERAHPLRQQVIDWEPSASWREDLYDQLTRLASKGCTEKRSGYRNELPEKLIRLQRLQNRYVVYEPCNGVQARLFFMGGRVEYIPGGADSNLMLVQRAEPSPEAGFTLTVAHAYFGCRKNVLTLRLEPLPTAGWYRVELGAPLPGGGPAVWSTPQAAAGLDVLVNVCNTGLANEYPFEREH